jgi:hypothetical protein
MRLSEIIERLNELFGASVSDAHKLISPRAFTEVIVHLLPSRQGGAGQVCQVAREDFACVSMRTPTRFSCPA